MGESVSIQNYCQTEIVFSVIVESFWITIKPQAVRNGLDLNSGQDSYANAT